MDIIKADKFRIFYYSFLFYYWFLKDGKKVKKNRWEKRTWGVYCFYDKITKRCVWHDGFKRSHFYKRKMFSDSWWASFIQTKKKFVFFSYPFILITLWTKLNPSSLSLSLFMFLSTFFLQLFFFWIKLNMEKEKEKKRTTTHFKRR